MTKLITKHRLTIALFLVLTLSGAVVYQIYDLDQSLQKRLSQGWFLPPVEFYSSGHRFLLGTEVSIDRG